MFKLMQLELKKFKFQFISKGTIIANLCILAFLLFVTSVGKAEGDPMWLTAEEGIVMINIFVMCTFIIYGGCVLSKFVISEYRQKTIQLMFMYPINRKKLLLSKLCIVFIFTVLNVFLGNVFLITSMSIAEHFIDMIPGEFDMQTIVKTLPMLIASIMTSGLLAIVPLYFGMRKKSTVHTVVAAVIITMLTCSNSGVEVMISRYFIRFLIIGGIAFLSVLVSVIYTLNNLDSTAME